MTTRSKTTWNMSIFNVVEISVQKYQLHECETVVTDHALIMLIVFGMSPITISWWNRCIRQYMRCMKGTVIHNYTTNALGFDFMKTGFTDLRYPHSARQTIRLPSICISSTSVYFSHTTQQPKCSQTYLLHCLITYPGEYGTHEVTLRSLCHGLVAR